MALVATVIMVGLARTIGDPTPHPQPKPAPSIGDHGPDNRRWAFVPEGVLDERKLLSPDKSSSGPDAGWSTETLENDWATETEPGGARPEAPQRPRFSLTWPWRAPQSQPPAPRVHTLKSRLAEIGPTAGPRVQARFGTAKALWPPAEIALVAIKDEKRIELFARPAGGRWAHIHSYPVLAASGRIGPKLRQGDKQVPEGIYGISFLNPNSAFHVSLRVNYPNAFDRRMAARDGRRELGGDIMIHGKNLSAGCLAIGDDAAEELFVLAAATGLRNIKLLIAPTDFRLKAVPPPAPDQPAWLAGLYADLALRMAEFQPPAKPASPSLMSLITSAIR